MPSTLSVRRINEEQIGQYAMWVANGTSSTVALPNFQRSSQRAADNAPVDLPAPPVMQAQCSPCARTLSRSTPM